MTNLTSARERHVELKQHRLRSEKFELSDSSSALTLQRPLLVRVGDQSFANDLRTVITRGSEYQQSLYPFLL